MTIKIPIFKSCLLAASLAQLTCSLSADTKLDFDTLTMPKGSKCTEVPFAGQKYLQDKKPTIKINFDLSRNFLYFPKDGQQPSTIEAGWCSGARNINDPEITQWYVNIFKENFINKNTWPKEFESALTTIASDPVGRVLLYRLIIELTRINEKNSLCNYKGHGLEITSGKIATAAATAAILRNKKKELNDAINTYKEIDKKHNNLIQKYDHLNNEYKELKDTGADIPSELLDDLDYVDDLITDAQKKLSAAADNKNRYQDAVDNVSDDLYEANQKVINSYESPLFFRNKKRPLKIKIVDKETGSSFSDYDLDIEFAPQTAEILSLNHKDSFISTSGISRTGDISLFHEMLHWFHFLQDPIRYSSYNSNEADIFKYPLRCYYGDAAELVVWGGNVDAEEIATILGTPDYNNTTLLKYIPNAAFLPTAKNDNEIHLGPKGYLPKSVCILRGDDLSENAYRLSRSQNEQEKFYMRFGHVQEAIDTYEKNHLPKRYFLANELAKNCYKEITGKDAKNWNLEIGQAIKE